MLVEPGKNIHEPNRSGMTHPSFTGAIYVVCAVELDCLRLVDNKGEPILVECERFRVVDPRLPGDWVTTLSEEDASFVSYAPPEFRGNFFERWHDGDADVRSVFAQVYDRLCADHREQLDRLPLPLKRD